MRLAAVEPHLRRQPQLRHRALQRRHALHRRRQADAGRVRHDAAQPARDRQSRRTSTCRAATRCWCPHLRRTPASARRFFSRLQMLFYAAAGAAAAMSADDMQRLAVETLRRARSAGHRPRRDRERAVRAVHRRDCATQRRTIGVPVPGVELKLAPVGGSSRRGSADRTSRPDTGAIRELTRAAFDEEGLLPHGRRAAPSSIPTIRRRASCSRAGSTRTSSSRPAPGCASARCAQRLLAHARRPCAGRRDRRARTRRGRRRCLPERRRVPRRAGRRQPHRWRDHLDIRRVRRVLPPARRRSTRRTPAVPRSSHAHCCSTSRRRSTRRRSTDKGSINQQRRARPPRRAGRRSSTRRPVGADHARVEPERLLMTTQTHRSDDARPRSTCTCISRRPESGNAADDAARKYFGDSGATRDAAAIAEYYRSRKMACVVFTVDERLTGRRQVSNDRRRRIRAREPRRRSSRSRASIRLVAPKRCARRGGW